MTCGTGGWTGPIPGDPDNNLTLSATTTFGGINISIGYPATNPHAIAFVMLYRGIVNDFDQAIELGKFTGTLYHDRIEVAETTTFYYWIKMVTVNGTVNTPIGPVSAIALKFSSQLLDFLTGQLPFNALNTTLQAEILNITTLQQNLLQEVNDRIASHDGLSAALAEVDQGLLNAMTYIGTETTQRTEGQNALAQQIDAIAAANDTAMAAILTEQTTRASEDASLASQITTVVARLNDTGEGVAMEQRFTVQADLINGLQGQYAIKIQTGTAANPVIAGFGLAVDDPVTGPATSAFTILADKFAIYTNNGSKQPFAVNGDIVYIDGQLRVGSSTGETIGALTDRMINMVGEFSVAPAAANYRVNDVYKNTTDGNTYILKESAGVKSWAVWIAKGADGTNASSLYTWIKYADSATGTGLSDSPDGKTYIGLAYNKSTPVESSVATDYSWSLIKGTDGIPGAPGENGVTTYTWIKYSDSADGSDPYDTPTASTQYIGISTNRTTATESTVKTDYVWSKFKGDQGVPGAAGLSNAMVYAYKRSAAAPADNPGAVTYTFGSASITTPSTDALANGWTKTIPAGTDPLYVVVASASGTGTTDAIAAGEWTAPTLWVKHGLNTATIAIYRRTATDVAPALPSAECTYNFTTKSLTGLNNSWSTTLPVSGDPYLHISTATAVSTADTDTIPASEWAAAKLLAKDGTNASPNYTWIKYADDAAGAGLSDDPTGKTYIGFAYNRTTPTESSTAADYTWSLIKGTDGVPGAPGENGVTTYTWIKYSDNADGTGLYETPTASTLYIGIATNKTTATESSVKTDYVWSKFKGDQGVPGSPGTPGSTGPRGNVRIHAYGSGWSDTVAYNAIVDATGTAPVNHDEVTITTGSSAPVSKTYVNGSWLSVAAWINGNMIVDGTLSVSGDIISGGTITGTAININGNFVVNTSGSVTAYVANLVRGTASNGDAPGLTAFKATSSGSGAAMEAVGGSSGYALKITSGSSGIVQTGGGSNYLNNVIAASDNAYSLGASGSLRWITAYLTSAVVVQSDERTKFDIRPLTVGLGVCRDLQTVLYKQKVAENIVTDNWVVIEPEQTVVDDFGDLVLVKEAVLENQQTIVPRIGMRDHAGVLAQQLKAVLDKYGLTNCGVWSLADPNDPDSIQAVRYEELVPFAIDGISTLADKLDAQELRFAELEARIAALELHISASQ